MAFIRGVRGRGDDLHLLNPDGCVPRVLAQRLRAYVRVQRGTCPGPPGTDEGGQRGRGQRIAEGQGRARQVHPPGAVERTPHHLPALVRTDATDELRVDTEPGG